MTHGMSQRGRTHGDTLLTPPRIHYDSDDETHFPQGGQIVSPRHWDRRQVAHTAGHSPLNAAALACQAYHGYQRGYYPLTAEIITSCGYRDTRGGVSLYCNDLFCSIAELWTHGKIDERSRGGLWWIGFWRRVSQYFPDWTRWKCWTRWIFMISYIKHRRCFFCL